MFERKEKKRKGRGEKKKEKKERKRESGEKRDHGWSRTTVGCAIYRALGRPLVPPSSTFRFPTPIRSLSPLCPVFQGTRHPVILFLFHLQSTSLDRDDDAVHNQSADKMESNEQPAWINFPIKFSISIIPSLVFWFFPLGFRDRLFFFLYPTICISVAAILRGRHREYIPEKKKEKKVSNGNLDESRGSRISRRQGYSTFSR